MRVHYVLLLAASAFFASVEADAVATDSAPGASTADRFAIAEKNAVSVSRSLRTAGLEFKLDKPLKELVLKGSRMASNDAERIRMLDYVEHLITTKYRGPATRLKGLLNYPDVLTELTAAAKNGEYEGTSAGQLIKRWVEKKLHPDRVSWVLGAKALEEGTDEYWFLISYTWAFNRAYGKRL